ncbi:ankyrin repeat domain-containing protein [Wolbachia endosymbiont of Brugia malayi]|uniref:ankyrin repeat domain-containing protein n=1 Tax=Wolbachia endosymbiont of Brugia malayi TaxID=80849 RepID=UPI000A0722B6|nr:ankyrin repeat domain-containing protein [Wolbachia endosymbiont of Brugia malayi]QCB61942.1 ankyrin repeat domain-containing protein [Wolbachia endosymbiont of Brugia malayi]
MSVVKLLIDNGADINAVNSDGLTPLSRTFSESKVGVCAYMMNKIIERRFWF